MGKTIRNKRIAVRGVTLWPNGDALLDELECIITNDEKGKTISINNGVLQFTIPFEPIERYLKRLNTHGGCASQNGFSEGWQSDGCGRMIKRFWKVNRMNEDTSKAIASIALCTCLAVGTIATGSTICLLGLFALGLIW